MITVGADIGGTNTKLAILSTEGDVLARGEIETRGEMGPDRFAERLVQALDSILDGHAEPSAIGLSVAALIDAERRIVQAPNLPLFEGADLLSPLRLRWPSAEQILDNDVNAAIVAEHRLGAGRGTRTLCMLSLGTGVGGGVILDGHIHRGSGGLAGELGHMVLEANGPLCTCGQPGHVEAFLSTEAIVARARATLVAASADVGAPLRAAVQGGEVPTPRVLAACAREGCTVSREVLAESGRWLGIACTNLTHALQPDRILIGGGVSRSGELLLGPAREEYQHRCMRAFRGGAPLVLAELGVDGAAIGAAILARDVLDASPDGNA